MEQHTMIVIDVVGLPLKTGQQHQQWQAWHGDELLCTARVPFFTAARVLLNRGLAPEQVLVMRHKDNPQTSLTSTIGAAAKLAVVERDDPKGRIEPRIAPYRAYPSD